MAVAASLSPVEVAALDAATFAALDRAVADRWTRTEEMLATACELLSALVVVQLRRGGFKGHMQPLKVPRPAPDQTARNGGRPKVQTGTALLDALGVKPGGEK